MLELSQGAGIIVLAERKAQEPSGGWEAEGKYAVDSSQRAGASDAIAIDSGVALRYANSAWAAVIPGPTSRSGGMSNIMR